MRVMKLPPLAAGLIAALSAVPACVQSNQPAKTEAGQQDSQGGPKVASGLKEALKIGVESAVNLAGRKDGYFGNPKIKIPMPDELRRVETAMRAVRFGAEVDEFVLGMNRAAERAAPSARNLILDAVAGMSFDDARKILAGSETAATDYFKSKTADQLAAAFRPLVESAMNEVGATKIYQAMMSRYKDIPFVRYVSVDIDAYVVEKALDGLFYLSGEEERKIRTDPKARVNDLLKEVFGK
jgi:hypothetical protein